MPLIEFTLPLRTVSLNNSREHWAAKAKRAAAQRRAVVLKCPPWPGEPLLRIELVRIAPRRLDDDNLRGALKHVRDGVAAKLRIDDASPLVKWDYAQEKGEPAVRVTILGPREVRGGAL